MRSCLWPTAGSTWRPSWSLTPRCRRIGEALRWAGAANAAWCCAALCSGGPSAFHPHLAWHPDPPMRRYDPYPRQLTRERYDHEGMQVRRELAGGGHQHVATGCLLHCGWRMASGLRRCPAGGRASPSALPARWPAWRRRRGGRPSRRRAAGAAGAWCWARWGGRATQPSWTGSSACWSARGAAS